MLILERAECRECANGHALEPTRQVCEPTQRRRVRPLNVIDRKRERSGLRQVDCQPVEPVQQRVDVLFAGVALALSEQSCRPGLRRRRAVATPLLRVAAATAASKSCRTMPNEKAASSSLARACRTVKPETAARARALRQQRRLADPRRPFDHNQRAGAGLGGRDRRVDRGELLRAFEQGRLLFPPRARARGSENASGNPSATT